MSSKALETSQQKSTIEAGTKPGRMGEVMCDGGAGDSPKYLLPASALKLAVEKLHIVDAEQQKALA